MEFVKEFAKLMSGTKKMQFKWPLMMNNITLSDRLKLAKFVLTSDRFTNGKKVSEFEKEWRTTQ